MEFPRRALKVERALAALVAAASLGMAWAQAGAPLAVRVRQGRRWLAWVAAREPAADLPTLHLAIYDPARLRLILIHVPGDELVGPRLTLDEAYRRARRSGESPAAAERTAEDDAQALLNSLSPEPIPQVSARLDLPLHALAAEDEPSLEVARALKGRTRSARVWLGLATRAARGLLRGDRAALDPLLFALELRRVDPGDLEPARLPAPALARDLLGRLLARREPPRGSRPIDAEVLNGTEVTGLAARAAKMLRLHGVDVLTIGSTSARRHTLVYDRIGDFRNARDVLAALGCRDAHAATRQDPTRVVDVSVLLGADCAGAFGSGDSAGR